MRMRFRSGTYGLPLTWMALAAFQILTTAERVNRHIHAHRTVWLTLDIVVISLWSMIFLLYFHLIFGSQIELSNASLRLRRLWRWRTIPYEAVVAIRPVFTDAGKPRNGAIELEIAQREGQAYPHEYLVLSAAKSDAFARALHEHVPQAEYELA